MYPLEGFQSGLFTWENRTLTWGSLSKLLFRLATLCMLLPTENGELGPHIHADSRCS